MAAFFCPSRPAVLQYSRLRSSALPEKVPHPNAKDTAALEALNTAALTIAAEHALDKVLYKIVDLARELADAQYAALGIPGPDGRLAQFVTAGMGNEQITRIGNKPTGRGVLGLLLSEPLIIRIPAISRHPELGWISP